MIVFWQKSNLFLHYTVHTETLLPLKCTDIYHTCCRSKYLCDGFFLDTEKSHSYFHIFTKKWPIFKILSPAHCADNCSKAAIKYPTTQTNHSVQPWFQLISCGHFQICRDGIQLTTKNMQHMHPLQGGQFWAKTFNSFSRTSKPFPTPIPVIFYQFTLHNCHIM